MFPLNVQEAAAYGRYGSCITENGGLFWRSHSGCGRFFSEDHCLYRDLYNRKECNRMGRKDGALDAAAYKDADRCGDVYRFDG